MKKNDLAILNAPLVDSPYITFMFNTHVGHQNTEKDVLQFKNFMKLAKERFLKKNDEKTWLPYEKQMQKILQDASFFRQGTESVAIIFTPEETFVRRLQIRVDNQYYVSKLPYLLALIKNKQFHYEYYLLQLNRDSMSLLKVDGGKVSEVSLPKDAPTDIKIALGDDELTGGNLNYSVQSFGGGTGNGKAGVAYHGINPKDEEVRIDWENYFQAVDVFLQNFLGNDSLPLYMMALPENQAVFKKIAKVKQFREFPSSTLSPAAINKEELEKGILKLNEALEKEEIKDYPNLLDGKFIEELDLLKEQASFGKLSHFFLGTSQLKDNFGEDQDAEYDRRQILNEIAYEVLNNSGEVFVLQDEFSPSQKGLLGILRY